MNFPFRNEMITHYKQHSISHAREAIKRLDGVEMAQAAVKRVTSYGENLESYHYEDVDYARFVMNTGTGKPAMQATNYYVPIPHHDGYKVVLDSVEDMGVKVIAQYAVMGPYDFVNILEAPDNETVTRVSVELSSRGSMRAMTLAAIPIDEFISSLKK